MREVVARLAAAGCVFAEEEARLLSDAAAGPEDLAAMVEQRVAGRPLEQVVGWARFGGLRITVRPGVFVPRRRTEFLADRAAALIAGLAGDLPAGRPVLAVDLCCGTGAIGAALLAAVPLLELHAVDIDPEAVRCARRNLGGRAQVHQGDLFAALPGDLRGRVDALVASPPYVPTAAIAALPAEARAYEPRHALDGGPDGLAVVRRIAAGAGDWLAPGGVLLVETGGHEAARAAEALAGAGWAARVARQEDRDAVAVIASAPAPPAPARPARPHPARARPAPPRPG